MKILYVTTISNTMNAFLIPHIEMLIQNGYEVHLACNIVKEIDHKLLDMGCEVFNIELQRFPLKRENFSSYKKLKKIIKDGNYDLIHTHTPVASAFTRIACRKLQNAKIVYTAHGFHFYNGAPLNNWLFYYPIEKWLAKYTDVLITINNEDYKRAKESLKPKRVEYIPGVGLATNRFNNVNYDKEKKRKEIGILDDDLVILSVGEINVNKNHETVIRALSKITDINFVYLICGIGPLKEHLENLIRELKLENNIKLLNSRNDIIEICGISDVFIFPSFREGLSVALMEAMASGLPIICSDIRGNRDLVENEKGGYLVSASNIDGFANKIYDLLKDENKRIDMGAYNKRTILNYDIKIVKNRLKEIYNLKGNLS